MPVHCFTVMRRIAERTHRRLIRTARRFFRRVVHHARLRISPGSALRRPATVSAKVCVASGLAGLGAAGIVAAGLTLGSTGAATPKGARDPASASAGAAAAKSADPGFLLDPGSLPDPGESIAPADPPILLDPASSIAAADPPTLVDPSAMRAPVPPAPLDPDGADDPADPRNRADPKDPPAKVPEPSSVAALGVGLLGWSIVRRPRQPRRAARPSIVAPPPAATDLSLFAGRRRGAGGR